MTYYLTISSDQAAVKRLRRAVRRRDGILIVRGSRAVLQTTGWDPRVAYVEAGFLPSTHAVVDKTDLDSARRDWL